MQQPTLWVCWENCLAVRCLDLLSSVVTIIVFIIIIISCCFCCFALQQLFSGLMVRSASKSFNVSFCIKQIKEVQCYKIRIWWVQLTIYIYILCLTLKQSSRLLASSEAVPRLSIMTSKILTIREDKLIHFNISKVKINVQIFMGEEYQCQNNLYNIFISSVLNEGRSCTIGNLRIWPWITETATRSILMGLKKCCDA